MLKTPTMEKLQNLKLNGMLRGLEEQDASSEYESLSFEERLGLLVDRETIERENRRLQTRLKQAKLKQTACFEDIDYRHRRGLDKKLQCKRCYGHGSKRHRRQYLAAANT